MELGHLDRIHPDRGRSSVDKHRLTRLQVCEFVHSLICRQADECDPRRLLRCQRFRLVSEVLGRNRRILSQYAFLRSAWTGMGGRKPKTWSVGLKSFTPLTSTTSPANSISASRLNQELGNDLMSFHPLNRAFCQQKQKDRTWRKTHIELRDTAWTSARTSPRFSFGVGHGSREREPSSFLRSSRRVVLLGSGSSKVTLSAAGYEILASLACTCEQIH